MKTTASLVILILLVPAFVRAAQVYGSLNEGSKSVGPKVRIEIACAGNTYPGETDGYGSYSIYIPQPGKCTLRVDYGGQWPEYEIYSYDDPVRYDFDLVRGNDGRYVLIRR
ncbi:MAG: hypothetical protein L0Y68_01435 [Candidatus Dadabacteria bacterium]|nr:hypothetical protein [Candidatus Dadabacteria bacterium]